MPIVLNTDPEKVYRLTIGDSVILHRRASGSDVSRAIEDARDPTTGRVDMQAMTTAVLTKFTVGWENVLDADDAQFEATPERVPLFVEMLGHTERSLLDSSICTSYREATASGKD